MVKMTPGGIELFVSYFKLRMGCFHVSSFVVVRSTCDHGDKLLLSLPLLSHIGILEKVVDNRVIKHVLVELIDY